MFKIQAYRHGLRRFDTRITKTLKKRKSTTVGQGWFAASHTLQDEVQWILRPDKIEGLRNFEAVVVKADAPKGKYWRGRLKAIRL